MDAIMTGQALRFELRHRSHNRSVTQGNLVLHVSVQCGVRFNVGQLELLRLVERLGKIDSRLLMKRQPLRRVGGLYLDSSGASYFPGRRLTNNLALSSIYAAEKLNGLQSVKQLDFVHLDS